MKAIARIGHRGIEIMADIPHAYPPDLTYSDVRRIRRALKMHDLKVPNINAFELFAQGDTCRPSRIEMDLPFSRPRLAFTNNSKCCQTMFSVA